MRGELLLVTVFGLLAASLACADGSPLAVKGTPLRWGFDDAGGPSLVLDRPWGGRMVREFGFDTWVMHYNPESPSLAWHANYIQEVDRLSARAAVQWIANLELANWVTSYVDDRGREWFRQPDGRHFFRFPADVLDELAKSKRLLGVMYDEPAHMQNCRNKISGANRPFMLDTSGLSLEQASDAFTEAAATIGRDYSSRGLRLYTEHVFPNMLHNYARAGYVAAPKILKESWSPICIAIAMGAAVEYGAELWVTPDLWGPSGYPGHGVEEYRSALLLAYHLGADCIYTENLAYDHQSAGKGSLILVTADGYKVTPYGAVAKWFRRDYVPTHPRPYTFRDVQAGVAIVRREDGCWGQARSWLPDTLFGDPRWHSTPTTEAWLDIWHLVTRGVTDPGAINWNATPPGNRPYQVFCPLDGVLVFDDHVGYAPLRNVEVVFLTGVGVSARTLAAVTRRVHEGATCVALAHLVPPGVASQAHGGAVVPAGRGRWVVTDSFQSETVRREVARVLPTEDAVSYRFGSWSVRVRPTDGDPNRLSVAVEPLR